MLCQQRRCKFSDRENNFRRSGSESTGRAVPRINICPRLSLPYRRKHGILENASRVHTARAWVYIIDLAAMDMKCYNSLCYTLNPNCNIIKNSTIVSCGLKLGLAGRRSPSACILHFPCCMEVFNYGHKLMQVSSLTVPELTLLDS